MHAHVPVVPCTVAIRYPTTTETCRHAMALLWKVYTSQ